MSNSFFCVVNAVRAQGLLPTFEKKLSNLLHTSHDFVAIVIIYMYLYIIDYSKIKESDIEDS